MLITLFLIIVLFFSLAITIPAKAICPVCIVAVGAGVGFSRWLGVDDTISGIWIGGITSAVILWTINLLNKKNIHSNAWDLITTLGYFILVVLPLAWTEVVGHPYNKIWGVDKLMLGIMMGSIIFAAGAALYDYLKKKNNNKAHFPFEKVVLPVGPLIILTIIFYFITK